jgi:hypothetical protein
MIRTAEVVLIGALMPWVRNRDVAGSSEKVSGEYAFVRFTDVRF